MHVEVVIVGSGVLGSAMAAVLARDGRHVTVIERSLAPPNRIVGELLQPGGVQALKELGLDECLGKTGGIHCLGFGLHDLATCTKLDLSYSLGNKGISFHHGQFVAGLRALALAEKRTTYIEGSVISLLEEESCVRGVIFRRKDSDKKEELRADLTIVADGGFSRLRGVNVDGKPTNCGHFIGLEHRGPLGKPGYLMVYTTPQSAVIVYQISEDTTRILTDVRGNMPKDLKQYLRDQVQDVPCEIREAALAAMEEHPIRSAPTFEFASKASFRPGVLTLGDAYNMRHPVTGAGMTVALKDTIIWRDLLRDIPCLADREALQAAQRTFQSQRKGHSFTVNLYASVHYNTICPGSDEIRFLRSSFFEYLAKSDSNLKDIMGMISITETRPALLLYHLVALTLFSACRAVRKETWWNIPRGLLHSAAVSYKTVAMVAPLFWSEVRSCTFF